MTRDDAAYLAAIAGACLILLATLMSMILKP